jgi:hypothetical protein
MMTDNQSRSENVMLRKLCFLFAPSLMLVATPAFSQVSVVFQNGTTMLPGGGFYEGTIDTEFRAANPTESQADNENISIDQFDAGFQTQAAIRFENLLISQGGLVPDDLANGGADILNAELRIWKNSPSEDDAHIDFNRVVGPDTTSGDFWQEDDTWASLGGDLIPDEFGLLDGDPITRDDIEAAAVPDFQDDDPGNDSADRLGAGLDAGLSVADAIDNAFFRYNVTDAVRDWLYGGAPNYGWAISNNTGDGWDFASSELMTELESEWGEAGLAPEYFRPQLAITYVSGPILDVDGDGDVDEDDFSAFLNRLAVEIDGPISTGAKGDFDFDRDVDLNDFKYFKDNYAEQHAMFPPMGAGALSSGAVPEPMSGILAALALVIGVIGVRRRAIL